MQGKLCATIAFCALLAGCNTDPPCPQVAEEGTDDSEAAGAIYADSGDPFSTGPLSVQMLDLPRCAIGAPRPLRLFFPVSAGTYAVVQYQHGFQTSNEYYDEILTQLASHGFIVVVPQMYEQGPESIVSLTTAEEAERAAAVREWIGTHLNRAIEAPGVIAATDRVGIAGHSRGGKVGYLLVKSDPSRVRGIVGVDPVDGTGGPLGGQPRLIEGPFEFDLPSLVIGTELGGDCAPAGDNYVQFFNAAPSPSWQVVALAQGHADMMDPDVVEGPRAICGGGDDLAGMRRLTAGLMIAFFRGTLQNEPGALEALSLAELMPIPTSVASK